MICFALQNFNTPTPFLLKTQRYYLMVRALSTNVLVLFIKFHINWNFSQKYLFLIPSPLKILYYSQFTKIFWIFYKKLIFKKMGLISNNLFKSYVFHTINGLCFFDYESYNKFLKQPSINISQHVIEVSKPIQTFNFSFHKKVLNSVIFFIVNLLVENYYTHLNFYKLVYSFILFKNNFNLYPALNYYYLKIRNN